MKAYEHFNDPEWDGEPLPPEDPRPGPEGPKAPPSEPPEGPGGEPEPPAAEKIVIKLADGKDRTIQYIAATTYWSHDGKPISAQEFMAQLFGDLSSLVTSEDDLRKVWSDPDTRIRLLQQLGDLGYDSEKLEEMKRLIDAPNSDIFDVLTYVRFTLPPLARSDRADLARSNGLQGQEDEMRRFLDYVLQSYETHGVEELSPAKIGDFLKVKYGSTNDAKNALGSVKDIRSAFIKIQAHLFTS